MAQEAINVKVYRQVDEVRSALAKMGGLTIEVLHQVIERGEAGRASATPLDPLNAPGQLGYIWRVRAIRELLLPAMWTKEDPVGCAMTVSPNGKLQIMIATGDDATGADAGDDEPTTRYPKGSVLRDAIEQNRQIPLPFPRAANDPMPAAPKPLTWPEESRQTWVLLINRIVPDEKVDDPEKKILVRSELSRPNDMYGDYPGEWVERIILPDLEIDPSKLRDHLPSFTDVEDIDVKVGRK